ncbi:MAG: TlyA family RNA methyltransferase [Ruminococcaceae bacterium]|nr:TlyA family RNA methyltransferase [Oscillospiraceae bacterium]
MSVRLDVWLVQHGVFGGRDVAKRHIEAGEVTVNGRTVKKPAAAVDETDTVCCDVRERYVGRGGYKLEKAIECAALDLNGVVAMDVGASTGGFTDCMRQYGARLIYAVDVGSGQLHPSLREDAAVISLENTDIRDASVKDVLQEPPAFCSIDVSFISLKQVLPSVLDLLAPSAMLVCLIKPQFEAGRSAIGKNGVVKDRAIHQAVLRDVLATCSALQCGCVYLTYSPIRGGEGNIEYLAVIRRNAAESNWDIKALVNEAFSTL